MRTTPEFRNQTPNRKSSGSGFRFGYGFGRTREASEPSTQRFRIRGLGSDSDGRGKYPNCEITPPPQRYRVRGLGSVVRLRVRVRSDAGGIRIPIPNIQPEEVRFGDSAIQYYGFVVVGDLNIQLSKWLRYSNESSSQG